MQNRVLCDHRRRILLAEKRWCDAQVADAGCRLQTRLARWRHWWRIFTLWPTATVAAECVNDGVKLKGMVYIYAVPDFEFDVQYSFI